MTQAGCRFSSISGLHTDLAPAALHASLLLSSDGVAPAHLQGAFGHHRDAGLCYGRGPWRSLACGLLLQRPPDCPKTPWHMSDALLPKAFARSLTGQKLGVRLPGGRIGCLQRWLSRRYCPSTVPPPPRRQSRSGTISLNEAKRQKHKVIREVLRLCFGALMCSRHTVQPLSAWRLKSASACRNLWCPVRLKCQKAASPSRRPGSMPSQRYGSPGGARAVLLKLIRATRIAECLV